MLPWLHDAAWKAANTYDPKQGRPSRLPCGRSLPDEGGVRVSGMTAQPSSPGTGDVYQVIHLGGQEAAIVPLAELRRLQTVERLAPAEVIETAEIETTLAAHREWVAAGRPGAVSHDMAMAELLADS
jgi:hypothetical protein